MAEEAGQPRRRHRRRRRPRISNRMLQILLYLYDNAGETRNTDTLIRWAIAAVMFPLNTAMLLFSLPQSLRGEPAGLFIGIAELVFVVQWFLLEMRMQGLIEYWLARMLLLESILRPLRRIFGGTEYRRRLADPIIRTHRILKFTIYIFGFLGMVVIALYANAPVKKSVFTPNVPSVEESLHYGFQKLESMDNRLQEIQQGIQKQAELERRLNEQQKEIDLLKQQLKPAPKPSQPQKGKRK